MEKLVVGALLFGLVFANIGCRPSLCDNTPLKQVESPSGTFIATVFERNCGATTDFSRMVSVGGSADPFSDDTHIVFIVSGQEDINVRWIDGSTLKVDCTECSPDRTFRKKDKWGVINILY